MERKGKFYVIEGDNGVGKSTLIHEIYLITGAEKIKTPTDGYVPIRSYIHQRALVYAKFLYYLSSTVDASRDISNVLKTKDVLCDRYVFSSLADFCILSGLDFEEVIKFYELLKGQLEMPDATFWIKCSHEERVRRLLGDSTRQLQSDKDNKTEEYSRKTDEFYTRMMARDGNWHIIDNTHKTIDETVAEVLSLM